MLVRRLSPLLRTTSGGFSLNSLRLGNRFASTIATTVSPTPSTATTAADPTHLSKEELEKIVRLIEKDPLVLMEVVAHLKPEERRRIIVAGGAMEWFGKDSAEREVREADQDNDRLISPKDFDHWFESAQRRKQEEKKKKEAEIAITKAAPESIESTSSTTTTPTPASRPISFSALCLIGLEAALPFVGFGFLDNATMILAGDFIDGTLGFYLNCSVLASAAMGNVCSGMLGMQVHGLIDKAVQKFNLNTPVLTDEQMKDRRVFFAGHIGGTLGIMVGLMLGMLPLLFMDNDANEKTDYAMFQRWDINNSGFVEKTEVANVLAELGLSDTEEKASQLVSKYGNHNRVNLNNFVNSKMTYAKGSQSLIPSLREIDLFPIYKIIYIYSFTIVGVPPHHYPYNISRELSRAGTGNGRSTTLLPSLPLSFSFPFRA